MDEPYFIRPGEGERVASRGHRVLAELPHIEALEISYGPDFEGVDQEALHGRIVLAPGVDAVEQAFDAWKYGEMSDRPYLEATIPTLLNADGDCHRMTVLAQWVPYGDGLADEVGERVVGELERYAPGLAGLVTSRRVLTPFELEREYGLPGGHIHHAEPGLDLLPICHAGNMKADASLKGASLRIALNRLRVAQYPGGGTHHILFDFYARHQTAAFPERSQRRRPCCLANAIDHHVHAALARTSPYLLGDILAPVIEHLVGA